jgi:hypothetical protein
MLVLVRNMTVSNENDNARELSTLESARIQKNRYRVGAVRGTCWRRRGDREDPDGDGTRLSEKLVEGGTGCGDVEKERWPTLTAAVVSYTKGSDRNQRERGVLRFFWRCSSD